MATSFFRLYTNSKSYVKVYEDHIEGVTIGNIKQGILSSDVSYGTSFTLTYDQICQVETSPGNLIIHASFAKYTVMALKNADLARNEIITRMKRNG